MLINIISPVRTSDGSVVPGSINIMLETEHNIYEQVTDSEYRLFWTLRGLETWQVCYGSKSTQTTRR